MNNEYITYELIENTYLFCVKRISDTEAAKDLSQDIIYEALRVISSGKSFVSFHSWYWRMARNKYADYIVQKRNFPLPIESAMGVSSDTIQPIESIIAAEDISRLNFSLSRLAAVHREIIIRYYLKEQTIPKISEELDIPVGTVKSRLFDAKKNLKERFDNMNNTGKTAYAPADVNWFMGFSAKKPALLLDSSKIYQQIMVICRTEAKTVNEIADEMGVAPVYLEEAIEKMLNVNLLVSKAKGKYQANHCIFPTEAYFRANLNACNIFHDNNFGERITERLLGLKDKITALDFYGNHFDFSYLLWIFYVEASNVFGVCGTNIYISKYADKYPDEAERDYRLTMQYILADEVFDRSKYGKVRQVGWSNLHQYFSAPAYGNVCFVNYFEHEPFPNDNDDGIDDWRRGRDKWVDESNFSLLLDLAKNPQKALSAFEEEKAAEFLKSGLLKKENDGFAVQLPIFTREIYNRIIEMIKDETKELAEEYSDMTGKAVEKELLPFVRKDLMSNFIHWNMRVFFQQLASLFWYAWDKHLAQPEDYSKSAAGLYIITE